MKKEPPSVFETILWALIAIFLVWFLTVGVHREEPCIRVYYRDGQQDCIYDTKDLL